MNIHSMFAFIIRDMKCREHAYTIKKVNHKYKLSVDDQDY